MFKEKGYQVIENFLEKDFLKFTEEYFATRMESKSYTHSPLTKADIQAPLSYSFYGDPFIDTLLRMSTGVISEIVGLELYPSYSYSRLYMKGDQLHNHRDRESCQISATLSIAFSDDEDVNPIYFSKNEDKSDAVEIILKPGDLCLYRGCDLWHWRPPIKNSWYLQSFLHYVDANGPYKDFKFDGRSSLGTVNN